ncbi:MAG: hypothetical protein ACI9B8_003132 [Sulfitobacter sp.]|jgi:hypothetical protein
MNHLHGACHCGSVKISVANRPAWLTSCNCSLCHRVGSLWLHDEMATIELEVAPDATIGYQSGDKTLTLHTCRTCGSTTHWLPVDPVNTTHMAVNARMFTQQDISDIPIRRFDGAETWQYLD